MKLIYSKQTFYYKLLKGIFRANGPIQKSSINFVFSQNVKSAKTRRVCAVWKKLTLTRRGSSWCRCC